MKERENKKEKWQKRGEHRHLSTIDCLMVHTACLVCFISTVNGCIKKSLGRLALVVGTNNLKQSILETFDINGGEGQREREETSTSL
jgi:hypothetical protein